MNTPWKAILAFIGVFVAGAVFGGFFALRIGQQVVQRVRPRPLVTQPPPQQPQQFGTPPATQLLRRVAERLDLTDTQREILRPIVARAEDQISRIRQGSLEQTDAILRQMHQDFRAELTPDQRRKLDRMQKAQSDVMRKERLKRPGLQSPGMGPNPPNFQERPFQPQRPQNPPPQNYDPQPERAPPDVVSPPPAPSPADPAPAPRGL